MGGEKGAVRLVLVCSIYHRCLLFVHTRCRSRRTRRSQRHVGGLGSQEEEEKERERKELSNRCTMRWCLVV